LPQDVSTVDFKPTPTISADQIRFRKGRAKPRAYRCEFRSSDDDEEKTTS